LRRFGISPGTKKGAPVFGSSKWDLGTLAIAFLGDSTQKKKEKRSGAKGEKVQGWTGEKV